VIWKEQYSIGAWYIGKRLRNTPKGIEGMQNVTSKTNIRRSAKAIFALNWETNMSMDRGVFKQSSV
jgi:hypothetical protein